MPKMEESRQSIVHSLPITYSNSTEFLLTTQCTFLQHNVLYFIIAGVKLYQKGHNHRVLRAKFLFINGSTLNLVQKLSLEKTCFPSSYAAFPVSCIIIQAALYRNKDEWSAIPTIVLTTAEGKQCNTDVAPAGTKSSLFLQFTGEITHEHTREEGK